MTVSFSEHLDLLDLHGREVVASLKQMSPDARMPPLDETARAMAEEHWGTLEVWAWLLENPTSDWSQRTEPKSPKGYDSFVAGIATELQRNMTALADIGPDATIDYFGRPGTTAEVARLLAHEAITTAQAVSMAAVRTTPSLAPKVASDGVDQLLHHWESSESDAMWQPKVVEVRATDTVDTWYLVPSQEADVEESRFRLVSPTTQPAVVVEGPAEDMLWWLHGHTSSGSGVRISGEADVIRALRAIFMHPEVDKPKRRRWWWFS